MIPVRKKYHGQLIIEIRTEEKSFRIFICISVDTSGGARVLRTLFGNMIEVSIDTIIGTPVHPPEKMLPCAVCMDLSPWPPLCPYLKHGK